MREVRITEREAGQRLDKFLVRYLPGAGKSFLYKMLRKKNIVLNGKKAEGKELLKKEDCVAIYFSDETLAKFQSAAAEETDYPVLQKDLIVYENKNLVAVNKPSGMLSQKAEDKDLSLVEYIRGYLLKSGAMKKEDFLIFRPGVCNRLDRNTSGLVLSGKTLAVTQSLSEMIRTRQVKKYYLALVQGHVAQDFKAFGWLEKNDAGNRVQIRNHPTKDAVTVETACRPLAYRDSRLGPCTLLEVELITGRTHQIRAQLASMGYPLAGDPKYGDAGWNRKLKAEFGLQRQFLHAAEMRFPADSDLLRKQGGGALIASLPKELRNTAHHIFGAELFERYRKNGLEG